MSLSVPRRRSGGSLRPAALALLIGCFGATAVGQVGVFGDKGGNDLRIGGSAKPQQRALAVVTTLTAERLEPGAVATVTVAVTIPEGFHLYSTAAGFSGRTKIELKETPGLELLGEFAADHPPKRGFDETFKQEVEKYTGKVTWTRFAKVVDPAAAKVSGTLAGTYCSSGVGGLCIRANEDLSATLTQAASKPAGATFTKVETPQVGSDAGPATLRFSLAPENAKVGDTVTLSVAMTLADGWHTYAVTQPPKVLGAMPTAFKLAKAKGLTPYGEAFLADQEPEKKTLDTEAGKSLIEQHSKTVTWTREFRVDDASYGIDGSIRYVTCDDERCLQPRTIAFALGSLEGAGAVPAALPAPKDDSGGDKYVSAGADEANLPLFLGLAFLGGLILNVMPCVLPVVAIKVMSFVQQAGEDRGRVFVLNAVYAAGVISVFLFLAALAALPEWFGGLFTLLGLEGGRFAWGGLFQSQGFNAAMACLVFAMGLSLLGVFEIPIPGMIGSAAAGAQREGLTGAFLTGVFATLLATPCTGPFMGTTLAWSVRQPAAVTFLIWATMGLGMASPYLLFGIVPGAVKLLPKPGAWMLYFKQFAGFVLMATVVFILSWINTNDVIALLVVLLGIGLAVWLIGMVQFSPSTVKRRIVSVAAVTLGAAVAMFGYQLTVEPTHKLAWEDFSTARVNTLQSENKTVLIDFTADWCFNCITNERIALNTEETKSFVEKHGVVPLRADYTDYSDEITNWLERFDRQGIPLTVIFPAGRPNEPIILDGVYTQRTLLKNLDEAVRPAAVASRAVKTAATQ